MNIFAIIFIILINLTYVISQFLSIKKKSTDKYHWTFSAAINENILFANIMFSISYFFYLLFLLTTYNIFTFAFILGFSYIFLSIFITFVPLKYDNEKPHIDVAMYLFIVKYLICLVIIFYSEFQNINYKIFLFMIITILFILLGVGGKTSKSLPDNNTKKDEDLALMTSISELLFNLISFYILLFAGLHKRDFKTGKLNTKEFSKYFIDDQKKFKKFNYFGKLDDYIV